MYNQFLKYISVLFFFFVSLLSVHAGEHKFTLVIDAGHGGKDAGAIGKFSKEKNINLKVAMALGRLVENNCSDVKVVYTRTKDVFVTLQDRAAIANKNNADLFISIHTNSLPKGKIAYGTETYTLGIARADENLDVAKRENSVIMYEDNYKQVYEGFDPNRVESYIIFELMQDKHMEQSVELARCIQQQYVGHAGRRNKGVHQAGFLVLRATSMPAVLTELGFISTPSEEKFLNSDDGVRKLSRSIYNGFLNYRKSYGHGVDAAETVADVPEVKEQPEKKVELDEEDKAERPERVVLSPKKPAKKTAKVATKKEAEKVAPAATRSSADRPVFKVQLLVSTKPLKSTDRQFKGIRPIAHYKEKGMYKYTTGSSTDYEDIKRIHRSVAKKMKGTFIVAFRRGERMNLSEAIKLSKRK